MNQRCFHIPHRRALAASIAVATALLATSATAQTSAPPSFPSQPITIIVPFTPGGADRAARLIAAKMQASLKQPVVLDYKPGATGLIGAGLVQRAKPDGYTLLYTSNSGLVVAPMLRQPQPFDAAKDFAPVSMVMRYAMFLDTPSTSAFNTVPEFVAAAKAKPGSFNYGSPGLGSVGQLTSEIFARNAGITMTHVPYKGPGEAQKAIVGGDVELFLDGTLASAELVKAGRIKALAVTGDKRLPAFPNIPTMKEIGYPNVNQFVWVGIFAPKGTPQAIVAKLSEEIGAALKADDVRDALSQGGLAEVVGSTPAELAQVIEDETPVYRKLVKELDLRVE